MHIANDVLQRQVGRRRTNYRATVRRLVHTTAPAAWCLCAVGGQAITTAFVHVPQIIAGVVVLAKNWDPAACDKPLAMWCAVATIRMTLQVIACALMFKETTMHVQHMSSFGRAGHCCKYPLDVFGLFWCVSAGRLLHVPCVTLTQTTARRFVFGNVWLLTTHDCAQEASAVHSLTISFVVIQYGVDLVRHAARHPLCSCLNAAACTLPSHHAAPVRLDCHPRANSVLVSAVLPTPRTVRGVAVWLSVPCVCRGSCPHPCPCLQDAQPHGHQGCSNEPDQRAALREI